MSEYTRPGHEPRWRCRIGFHDRNRWGECRWCGNVPWSTQVLDTILRTDTAGNARQRAVREESLRVKAQIDPFIPWPGGVSRELVADFVEQGRDHDLLDFARRRASNAILDAATEPSQPGEGERE